MTASLPGTRGQVRTITAAEPRYRAGDYAAATDLLAPLTQLPCPDATALRITGLCRLRLGAVPEALDLLQHAHAPAPTDPWTSLHLGTGQGIIPPTASVISD